MNTPAKASHPTALLGTNLLDSPVQQHTLAGLHRVNYTPFGHTVKLPLGSIGFIGQVKGSATTLYLLGNGYRGYSTALLRFISSDSYSPFEEGGINAYAYCGADPINRSDSSGQSWFSLLRRVVRSVSRPLVGRSRANPAALISVRRIEEAPVRRIVSLSTAPQKSPAWTTRDVILPDGRNLTPRSSPSISRSSSLTSESAPMTSMPRRRAFDASDMEALHAFQASRGITPSSPRLSRRAGRASVSSTDSMDARIGRIPNDPPPEYISPPDYDEAMKHRQGR